MLDPELKKQLLNTVNELKRRYGYGTYWEDGGAGSGNWGHQGRKGKRGGSLPGGGSQYRSAQGEGQYGSFSKDRAAALQKHATSEEELEGYPDGTVVTDADGKNWTKSGSSDVYFGDDGEIKFASDFHDGEMITAAVPAKANPALKEQLEAERDLEARMFVAPREESPETIDNMLREQTGRIWRGLDEESKDALFDYTTSEYESINEQLRFGTDNGYEGAIDKMTSAIQQSTLPDMWLTRGVNTEGAAAFLGVSERTIQRMLDGLKDPAGLAGLDRKDQGFMSCGSTEGKGVLAHEVEFHIFCPEGTKGLYAEPFSDFGEGGKRDWDGVSGQTAFGNELETILQRGTSVRISRAWVENGKLHVECAVTGQDEPG